MPNLSSRGRPSFSLDVNPGAWEIHSHCPSFYVPTKAGSSSGGSIYSLPSSALGIFTVIPKAHHGLSSNIHVASLSEEENTLPPPLPHSLLGPHSRSGHVICGTRCKVKIQGPSFKKYEEFQKNNSRAWNQAQGPVWLHGSLTHEANTVSQSPRSQLYPWVWSNPSKFFLLWNIETLIPFMRPRDWSSGYKSWLDLIDIRKRFPRGHLSGKSTA